jgi:uncharacterized protein (TIGR02145 family)
MKIKYLIIILHFFTLVLFCGCQKDMFPVADFTSDKTTVNVGEAVNFNDLSENEPTSWGWSFEGGYPANSTVQNPSNITYDATGSYPVSLTVVNKNGVNTITRERYIIVIDSLLGQPCPGQPQITYGGQTYQTVRIGDQCWLKENLNYGNMINSDIDPLSFDVKIEKYCYGDNSMNCELLGGLYRIDEALGPAPESGLKGICPYGYHIPSDSDWYELEVFLDTSCLPENEWGEHGTDCGDKLKQGGVSGFEALFAGGASESGYFFNQGDWALFWTSTCQLVYNDEKQYWIRAIYKESGKIYKYTATEKTSLSVRCIKDR